MAHQNGRARMVVMGVKLLHHHDARLILFHHFNYTIVQCLKARGHVGCGAALRAADDAGLANMRRLRAHFEDGVAGRLQTGIDAQDAQARRERRQSNGGGGSFMAISVPSFPKGTSRPCLRGANHDDAYNSVGTIRDTHPGQRVQRTQRRRGMRA